MATNFTIKGRTETGWDALYPKTNTDQVEGLPSLIDDRIQALINGAPDALDTLKELADALGNDKDFAATVTAALAGKVDKVTGKQLTTEDFTAALKSKLEGIAAAATANAPSATTPLQDGTAAVGSDTGYARGDHVHPTDTSRAAASHTHAAATTGADGFISAADKSKLDGLSNYTHPTTPGNKHIPSGGAAGQILRYSADGTAVWGAESDTTYNLASSSADGLMSKTDKARLDGLATITTGTAEPASAKPGDLWYDFNN